MLRMNKVFLILILSALSSWSFAKGKLLIVGGALSSENEAVYSAFIKALPAPDSKVAIVPVASGKPVESAAKFRDDLVRYGLAKDQIMILPLAVRDDPSTQFDERQWRNNANQVSLAKDVEDIGGFWFVGGDQMRIVETLLEKPEQDSRLLKAIKERFHKGALIGGTSAGAAMMSHPMIAAGDSFTALAKEPGDHYYGMESQEYGVLYLHHGLGFFPYGIVDQHFDRKARLGRLIRALSETSVGKGYAVDEDTGMLVDLANNTLKAIGASNITILDAAGANFKKQPFTAKNLSLTILASGDVYNLKTGEVLNPDNIPSTIGNEYASGKPHQGAGMALANQRLDQLLGYELLDNADSKEVRRYSFLEDGTGFRYRFMQTDKSEAFWRYRSGARDQYTILNVRMDVEPISVFIQDR